MAKLWDKGVTADSLVEKFTVGNDRLLDERMAECDVRGSIAHITMLESIGLLTTEELQMLTEELENLLIIIKEGRFKIEQDVEDIHSQVELYLTNKLGDVGKKIHSGRSRNDQVLVDIKLYLKQEILEFKDEVGDLFKLLQSLSDKYKDVLMPGYTHYQVAMPSSFGLWFGAYAETLIDDIHSFVAAWEVVNQNPLGSAAGYGSSFPLDREMTTKLLGFGTLNYNSVSAQLSRGKSERAVANALSSLASTLNKLASDCTIFMNSNYGFISFPDELTTGSSIMPHKKNPDVWELIRANCNRIQSVPNEISLLTTNLPHGYHRDFQLLKDILYPALDKMHMCIKMSMLMLSSVKVNREVINDPKYDYLFTVEEVNRLVLEGVPFREAYKRVGHEVNEGKFIPDKKVAHTHKGSIGNLCTAEIRSKMESALSKIK
ncbi:Argininosuccinate lyase [Bacteroidales bacterium CF]|jgi:argininosuccinate lyase|nr:Argininosuccinate lyase [Bacteroidales bacterium CF]